MRTEAAVAATYQPASNIPLPIPPLPLSTAGPTARTVYPTRVNVVDGRMVLSPSDLVSFAACPHLTELKRASAAKLVRKPIFSDPAFELLLQRGREHEERYLVELETAVEASPGSAVKGSARRLTRIEVDRTQGLAGVEAAARETEMAMRRGGAIIYQATFFHADGGMSWRGHADFLVRVDAPSDLGDWSYEPADAKLARAAKAGAVLQLCAYAEMVGRLQGRLPEYIRLILGGPGHPEERLRLSDYYAYYCWSKAEFTAAVAQGEPQYPPAATYPEPVEKCESCNWSTMCDKRRRADDHLSLVAGITRNQRAALDGMGVTTMTSLSRLPIPIEKAPPRTSADALTRVREQARLQVESAAAKTIKYDLLPELHATSALARCPSRRPVTCSSTSRAIPSRSTRASSTCSASWSRAIPTIRGRHSLTPSGRTMGPSRRRRSKIRWT
jgi:predicted RecB family nuclease